MSDYEVDELFTGRFSLNYKNITEIFIIVHLTPYIRHIQKKIVQKIFLNKSSMKLLLNHYCSTSDGPNCPKLP